MLYEFKSKATGTVVMTEKVAERLLGIVGKAPGEKGIFLPEQMPAAIAALEAAIAQERTAGAAQPRPDDDETERDEDARRRAITLAQRAWPLLDMLRAALKAQREITWGV